MHISKLTLVNYRNFKNTSLRFHKGVNTIIGENGSGNTSIEDLEDVHNHIRETIKDAAGETYSPASLSIKSDLPEEADKLFQSLRLFVGESEEG
ncbi:MULTISPECIES: AAA family ATPase [Pseudomonas fluorescens group]|uniref:Endonuclease GajA/Old nuclease/RecF-like AAA domain-containing protein n=1 Tax=Pseudomonas azotoformans TaxID=47878 RepID=A0A4Q0HN61_PSEAZ|nr:MULTISPECIES: AAA family ATPase [Pseudomonas fluorescens group]RXE50285.1 hypothetical protein B4O85_23505 [Pseudomonas azotoformans]